MRKNSMEFQTKSMESLPAGVWEDVGMSRNTVEFRTKAMKSLPAGVWGKPWNAKEYNGIPMEFQYKSMESLPAEVTWHNSEAMGPETWQKVW